MLDTKRTCVDGLHSFFVLDRKSSGRAVTHAGKSAIKSEIMSNQQLAEELHKATNRKFKKHKVYSSFKDNIWRADI